MDQELEEGLTSVAAPLHDPDGRVVAAVNVSTSAHRRDPERVEQELVGPLLEAVAGIEAELAVLTAGTR